LEPFGTDLYEEAYRYAKLLGYSVCVIVPFMVVHFMERFITRYFNHKWNPTLEISSKSILLLLISICSYLYNVMVINNISPGLRNWYRYLVDFFLPNALIFAPLIILFYFILWKQQKRLKVKGKNKDDIISLEAENFIYAVSQQNYVILFYRSDDGVKEFRMRSTLKRVQEQILNSYQIHKSYIINPSFVEKTIGGSKNRFIVLHHIAKPLPVSRSYDVSNLLKKR
jgi:hypothetical protein